MARVKRGTTSLKTRRKTLKAAKGYRFGRSTKERLAREALLHAGAHAYRHRRTKKRDMRRLWNVKINAGAREGKDGISYSKFISVLKKKKIELDRKVLAHIAEHKPETFTRIVKEVRS